MNKTQGDICTTKAVVSHWEWQAGKTLKKQRARKHTPQDVSGTCVYLHFRD